MGSYLIALALLLLPEFQATFDEADKLTLTFDASADAELEPQIREGLEVRYRFHLRLCKRMRVWFDDCGESMREVHHIKYDPVTETYRVTVDRLDDREQPVAMGYKDYEGAIARFTTVRDAPLLMTPHDVQRLQQGQRLRKYWQARVVSNVNLEDRTILDWIPYVLTLGLSGRFDFDTDWVDLPLSVPLAPGSEED